MNTPGGELVRPVEEQQFHASRGAGEQAEVCAGSRNCGTQRIAHAGLEVPASQRSGSRLLSGGFGGFPFHGGWQLKTPIRVGVEMTKRKNGI